MAIYLVHEPVAAKPGRSTADRAVFVKDRFSWGAFLFGPAWLLLRGQWLVLLIYIAALGGLLLGLAVYAPAGLAYAPWFVFCFHLLLGFEATSIRSATLNRWGRPMTGVVAGKDLDDCERRYFATRPEPSDAADDVEEIDPIPVTPLAAEDDSANEAAPEPDSKKPGSKK